MSKLPFEKVKRDLLTKIEAKTQRAKPQDRSTDELVNYGVVNIDKPKGPTSHQTSDFVKRILKVKKAGHSGTLDPGVTGMLIVAVGNGTRIVQALLPAGKEYVALMYLHKPLDEKVVRKAFDDYTGKIMQKPPIKSSVRRIERPRTVYYSEIIEIDGQNILFRIGCQAGTYIRKYIHDLGQKLGVGAHMAELRRTKVANFKEDTICTLQDLSDAFHYFKKDKNDKLLRKLIMPVETAVEHIPKIYLLDSTIESVLHGRDVAVPGIAKVETKIKQGDQVAAMTLSGELVALGQSKMSTSEIMNNSKGIAIKIEKVFLRN